MSTQRFNKWHGRVGHLFQGRFKAILIQKDSHLLAVCRYVVLNPVRAKMVEARNMEMVQLPGHSGIKLPALQRIGSSVNSAGSAKGGKRVPSVRSFGDWGKDHLVRGARPGLFR